jgi:hypothetical protein
MLEKNIMKHILVGILVFLIVCVAWTHYKEGFTSGQTPKDTLVKLQAANTELTDILNISTYRTSYEEMITELEKWSDYSMLNILAQGKVGLDVSPDSIRLFNDLATFKKNLGDFMTILDKSE